MRPHVVGGLLMAALGVYAGGRRGGVGGALLGVCAVSTYTPQPPQLNLDGMSLRDCLRMQALGAGGMGFVIGATATLQRLEIGRL